MALTQKWRDRDALEYFGVSRQENWTNLIQQFLWRNLKYLRAIGWKALLEKEKASLAFALTHNIGFVLFGVKQAHVM